MLIEFPFPPLDMLMPPGLVELELADIAERYWAEVVGTCWVEVVGMCWVELLDVAVGERWVVGPHCWRCWRLGCRTSRMLGLDP
jgi:hypothetical protein